MKRLLSLLLLVVFVLPYTVGATPFRSTSYPLPRFVSLSSGEAYVRAGPGKKYPVKWVYQRKNLPLEIILEFDHWRKVRDIEGDEGWIHTSLLSGRRTAIMQGENLISAFKKPSEDSDVKVYFEVGVLLDVDECTASWCFVEQGQYSGWVHKKNLWGVYNNEVFDD